MKIRFNQFAKKTIILFLAHIGFTSFTFSQTYFQQQVDYKITAELDTLKNTLSANCIIEYTNNSNDALDQIVFHTWWNAFKDKNSAFASQQIQNGQRAFYFSDEEEKGGYSKLEFFINGKSINTTNYKDDQQEYSDIQILPLSQKLSPGEKVVIESNFILDIPYAFSRPGLKDNLYQMTQWYPKPAVYDLEGWHPMPYLSLGEFYSDFSSYEVELTMPISFSMVSTGQRDESKSSLNLDKRQRTIHSKAVNVHDFAWFASEYYIPYSESVEIDNEFIRVNVFVNEDNENWELPMKLAKRALTFFSEKIGPYPYPQMTLVESSCESQSGMEYPMITILNLCADSQQVDHLIAHEIAHNWFYGVIASNERDHAWMDEGLTSYFDHLYNDAFYENSSYYEGTPQVLRPSNDELTTLQNGVIHLARTGYAMSLDNPSIDFDPFNYLGMNYEKTAWIFKYLSQYIGDDAFEACVQSYYKKWQFKHPSPNDLLMHFHACCHKDISWLDSLISRKGLYFDYKIKTVKQDENELKVTIGKKGFLGLPYQLCGYDTEGKLVTSKWIDQLSKSEQIVSLNGNGIASLEINGEVPFLDYNRSNNNFKLNKVFKKSDPIKFRFLGMGSGSKINAVNFIPTLLYNKYDGLMLGSAFYSDLYPQQNFKWFFNPNYGTRSKSLAGSFGLVKDFPLKAENLRNLRIELFGKHFHYLDILNVDFSYSKLQPAISLNFAKGIYQTSQLEYKMHIISNQNFESSLDGMVFKKTNQLRIHQINFRHFKKNALSTNRFQFQLEYEKYDAPFNEMNQYLKASFEVNKRTYYNENSQFFIRLYGGYFIMNDQRESSNFADIFTRGSLALTSNGLTDHTYESYYLNRSALSNKNSPGQFEISDGGFKNTYTDYNTVGMSNDYLLSLNLKSDLPFKILKVISTRPYLDLAYSSTKEVLADPLEGQFYYSAGLSFEIGDIGGIYLPLFNSENLNINYTGSSLFSRLSFRINFNALSPWRYSDEIGRLIE